MAYKHEPGRGKANPANTDRLSPGERPLPALPSHVVEAALRRLAPEELPLVLKHKLVPTAWLPHKTYFAAASPTALADARAMGLTVVGRVRQTDYMRAVRRVMGGRLLQATTLRLHRQSPGLSNRNGPSLLQKLLLVGFFAVLLWAPIVLPGDLARLVTALPAALIFLGIVSLRILCLLPRPTAAALQRHVPDDALPVYSVLVPLFRETRVLPHLLAALRRLDYPRHKLDIKLILEEADTAMQSAVAAARLDDFIDVVVVPSGSPQTKPRALNYALASARGELVTIYDAEDQPDPQQLRCAAAAFACGPPRLACLQAELAFFNSRDNWLSRQFAMEYASLFRVILPALAADGLPLPLGGTSNHFRRAILESVGAWDPYNVTEDADLGIRLARAGYLTGVIDSRTLEEANLSLSSWIKQRSRWLKGFLLTWLVHMRRPVRLWRDLGPMGFWVSGVMTMGVFLSAALHPLFLAKAILDALTQAPPENLGTINDMLTGLALLLMVGGYACAWMIGARGTAARLERGDVLSLLAMPLYWLLFMPAAWLAFYEALFRPFHWHKTEHGLARYGRSAR